MRRCKWDTHAEDDVQVVGDVHAYNLDGHLTPLVCAPRHISIPSRFDLYGVSRTVWDVHGLWDHAMSAARFAELIEHLHSFPIRYGGVLKTLRVALVSERVRNAEGLALSISLMRLSTSGSESRRNWKREVICGMSFPIRCRLASAFEAFQLS